jgi:hypothetical protein
VKRVIVALDHTYTYSTGLLWTRDRPDAHPQPDNTQHSTRQTFMPQNGIGAAIPERERLQTYALDGSATVKWFQIYNNTLTHT